MIVQYYVVKLCFISKDPKRQTNTYSLTQPKTQNPIFTEICLHLMCSSVTDGSVTKSSVSDITERGKSDSSASLRPSVATAGHQLLDKLITQV